MRWIVRLVRTSVALAAVGVMACVGAACADAHEADMTTVVVIRNGDDVSIRIEAPLASVDAALGTTYEAAPGTVVADAERLRTYIADHLAVSADGGPWIETIGSPRVSSIEGIDHLVLDVALSRGGAGANAFVLEYDGIVREVRSHRVMVVLDTDGSASFAGMLTADAGSVTISARSSEHVAEMVRHGFHHVLDGADHLLFLLTLLLPAPLLAAEGVWLRASGVRTSLKRVLHVATAFTLGHSITLIAAAIGWFRLPSRPVEFVIAVSVAVSALHAIRPLVPRGDAWIASVFGLVHGMAFAAILDTLGLRGSRSWTVLAGFNVGIELAQLAVIALTFPSIYVIARTRFGEPFRVAGASVALVAAAGWGAERLGLIDNPLRDVEASAVAHPGRVVVGLAAAAAVATVLDRQHRRGDVAPVAVDEPVHS